MNDDLTPSSERAVRLAIEVAALLADFTQWVATNRAYNGSDHQHGQSLYNECLNAVLPSWANEYVALADAAAAEVLGDQP